MRAACLAALAYFVLVFALAFALGVARTLIIAPHIGETAAVLLEVPVLIVASWIVVRRLLRNRSFTLPQRAVMGAIAFAMTMASEAMLSVIMRNQGVTDWAKAVATPLGLVGLAGQIAFAAMPILVGLAGMARRPR